LKVSLGCMITVILVALVQVALCQEDLWWGVERIRTPCVWDQNEDLVVDSGSNVREGVKICVIDTGDLW